MATKIKTFDQNMIDRANEHPVVHDMWEEASYLTCFADGHFENPTVLVLRDRYENKFYRVTKLNLIKAMVKWSVEVMNDPESVNEELAKQARHIFNGDFDYLDYDAVLVDVVVQHMLFGKLVYA